MMEQLYKYFPELSGEQKYLYSKLYESYNYWNRRINVISRKDFHNFYLHHVLHSMAVAKIIQFVPGTRILDVGTGGGFPGIPLAILFPESSFTLVDSVNKKLRVIDAIRHDFELHNITTLHTRIEEYSEKFDFVVSRAVTQFPRFVTWVKNNVGGVQKNELANGIIYLKGGEMSSEIELFKDQMNVFSINRIYEEGFFQTKKVLHLPIG